MIFFIEHGNKVGNINTPANIKKFKERKEKRNTNIRKRRYKKKRKGKKRNKDKTIFYYGNKIMDAAFILASRSTCTDDG